MRNNRENQIALSHVEFLDYFDFTFRKADFTKLYVPVMKYKY